MNLDKLRELSAKATKGHCVAQLYAGDSWYVAYGGPGYGDIPDSSAGRKEDAEFDAALRNWFRVHEAELLEMEKDAGRYRWLRNDKDLDIGHMGRFIDAPDDIDKYCDAAIDAESGKL